MNPASISRRTFTVNSLCATLPSGWVASSTLASGAEESRRVVRIVIGPSKHPPGTHECAATGRLLKGCIEQAIHRLQIDDLSVELHDRWPDDHDAIQRTATFVFVGDFFPPMRMEKTEAIMADLAKCMGAGCGITCIHYATGLGAQDVSQDGDHPLLEWLGGYFATKCPHHQSIARVFDSATIVPAASRHPVLHGWKSFTIHDEPYINNYFGKQGMRPGVVPLATASLPPENPREEVVAWGVERSDGGRGVGIVMPHFFRNWKDNDLRKLILNGIFWTAKMDIPAMGIDVAVEDLQRYQPDSVEPLPKKKST